MKYQVILNDTEVLSTHKSKELAERALKRWRRKHSLERMYQRAKYGWLDPKIARSISGVYQIRTV